MKIPEHLMTFPRPKFATIFLSETHIWICCRNTPFQVPIYDLVGVSIVVIIYISTNKLGKKGLSHLTAFSTSYREVREGTNIM